MAGFRHVSLSAAVGRGGANKAIDVASVQEIINAHPAPTLSRVIVDGECGPATISAIEVTERWLIHAKSPDGRLDPRGPTLHALNALRRTQPSGPQASQAAIDGLARQLGLADPEQPGIQLPSSQGWPATPQLDSLRARPNPFPRADVEGGTALKPRLPPLTPARRSAHGHQPPDGLVRAAQAAQERWHVPAAVTLAQWALESTWGHSTPPGSNNPFGIKAAKGQPFVMAPTTEEVHGRRVHIIAPFRVFPSMLDAFDAHGELLATGTAYIGARPLWRDPDAYARALTHHYASDSGYGDSLIRVMRGSDLYRFGQLQGR